MARGPAVRAGMALVLCLAAAAAAARAAEDSWQVEAAAERLELREELLAAQLAYQSAARLASEESRSLPDDERAYAWARFEFFFEKAAALAPVTGAAADFLEAAAPFCAPAPGTAAIEIPLASTRQRLRWLRALALDRLGRDPEIFPAAASAAASPGTNAPAAGAAGDLRFATAWRVAGPFDASRVGGFDLPQAPETYPVDPAAEYAGPRGPIRWRPLGRSDPLGRLDGCNCFSGDGGALLYAAAWYRVDADRAGVLRLGADGPVALWVNGQRIGGHNAPAPLDPDRLAYPVRWKSGWNEVLLKLAPGPDGWRFQLREAVDGDVAAPGVWSAEPPAPSGAGEPSQPLIEADANAALPLAPEFGALSVFAARVRADADDHRARYYLGALLDLRDDGGGASRFDREALLRTASDAAPAVAIYRLAFARSVDRDAARPASDREENLRRRLLEYAGELSEARIASQIDLGRYALDLRRQPSRAEAHADAALEGNPLALRARLLRADIDQARGWTVEAELNLRETTRRHPGSIDARLRLARLERDRGRFAAALPEYRAAALLDANHVEAFQGVVSSLRRIGQDGEAARAIAAAASRLAGAPAGRRALYAAYAELGDWAGLRAAADGFLRQGNPDDADALAAHARALEEEGDRDAALAAWRLVEELHPADALAGRRRAALLADAADPAAPASSSPSPADAFAAPTADFPAGPGDSAEEFRAWALAQSVAPPHGADRIYLLFDADERITAAGERILTVRAAARALTPAGAAELGRQRVDLSDAFGRVLRARVLRADGAVEEGGGAPAGDAVAPFLPGVAPGETAEWIVEYRRPLPDFFDGHYAQLFFLARDAWAQRVRYRIEFPADRLPRAESLNGAPPYRMLSDPGSGRTAFLWSAVHVPARSVEPLGPPALEIEPAAAVTTFQDWNDFARWYWRRVEPQWHAPPEVRELARRFHADNAEPDAALAAAHRWIAQNIRHRDSVFDLRAYVPHSPRTILARRYGDGKDRALLLGLFARELGFDARPTLAWAAGDAEREGMRSAASFALPLPHVFNHAGVRVAAKDGVRVLDANQPYALALELPHGLSGALVLAAGPAAEWFLLPDAGARASVWEEEGQLSVDAEGSAEWAQNVAGRGVTATFLRAWFGPADRRQEAWRKVAGEAGGRVAAAACDLWPEIPGGGAAFSGRARLVGHAVIPEAGVMRVRLPSPFLAGEFGRGASLPGRWSDWAGPSRRESDLLLPSGFRIQRRLRVDWPEGWTPGRLPAPVRLEAPFGRLDVSWVASASGAAVEAAAEITTPRVAREQYGEFRRFCARADEALDFSLTLYRGGSDKSGGVNLSSAGARPPEAEFGLLSPRSRR